MFAHNLALRLSIRVAVLNSNNSHPAAYPILDRLSGRSCPGLVPKLLFIAGATQIVFAFMMVLRQSLRGLGDTLWTLLITSFSSWCVRLPCVWFLGIHLDYGLVGIWYALLLL